MCSDLNTHLAIIQDPRSEKNKLYPLEEMSLLCSCAVVSGADGWQSIADFGRAKLAWLRQFQASFVEWTRTVVHLGDGEVVAIDGKALRRSHDRRRGQRAIHRVSAWASAQRLSLGQVATEAKSNEITAIPELLTLLEIKGCIVTIDAVGCQTATPAQIVAQGAD